MECVFTQLMSDRTTVLCFSSSLRYTRLPEVLLKRYKAMARTRVDTN